MLVGAFRIGGRLCSFSHFLGGSVTACGAVPSPVWSKEPKLANFKEIMVMCLDGVSYSGVTTALECSNRDIAKTKALIAA